MTHSEDHHMTGAYALDALDDLERARFEQHLAGCEDCRAEVDSLRETAAHLAAITDVEPPAGLRERVLGDVSSVRPLPPPTTSRTGSATRRPVRDGRRRRRILVAAAAAVLVAGGVGVGIADRLGGDDRSQVALSATEQVLRADDARSVTVDLPGGSSATVTRSARLHQAVIETRDMAPAPEGKVYQLWWQDDQETMLPAGVMPAGADNTVLLEGDAMDAQAVGVTVEPAGGSSTPTTEPIAVLDLGQAT